MSENQDKQGRKYALVSEVEEGTKVLVDDGFTCVPAWSKHIVRNLGNQLYIDCRHGKHFLDGQVESSENGDFYKGIYLA